MPPLTVRQDRAATVSAVRRAPCMWSVLSDCPSKRVKRDVIMCGAHTESAGVTEMAGGIGAGIFYFVFGEPRASPPYCGASAGWRTSSGPY
jgi:hypothetical protein